MYPSGTWRGYWDEAGFGRQSMRGLTLSFQNGLVEGEGADIIGPFTFAGNYSEDGTVTLMKYYRRHDVLYQGTYDGEGTIFGQWTIDEDWRGAFALTPQRPTIAAGAAIQEITPEPDDV